MKLAECQEVANALNLILKDYPYLEYNEASSQNHDFLRVKVKTTHLETKRDFPTDADKIREKLEEITKKKFRPISRSGDSSTKLDKHYRFFSIHKTV